ncbi:hypothetical protein C2S53_001418 [Perilla frutescens var. hirtella]|uniref:Uncharacterized protein n=1 Tax=Perilla frutescens var. hirtella TaxID=608512 RepID=A0AAD4J355_PERFH|nr:hypothetical protein C2S53_001418 [Perilla frutescens var. hirtella]
MFNRFHDRFPESNGNGEISGEAVSSPRSQSSNFNYLIINVSNLQWEIESSNSIVLVETKPPRQRSRRYHWTSGTCRGTN